MKITAINLKTKKARTAFLLCVLIIIGIASAAILHAKAPNASKPALFSSGGDYVEGIDVSGHNQDIDWQAVAGATDFAIIRCGYRGYGNGEIVEDELFAYNISEADRAGIPYGIYFYSQATTEAEAREEAKFALKALGRYTPALPVFIDFEYAFDSDGNHTGRLFNAGLSGKEAAQVINAFCEEINGAGLLAGVYSSSSVLTFDIRSTSLNRNIYVWVADYNETVSYPGSYDAWQYSKHGSCDGVNSKYVDVNRWFIK